MGLPCDSVLWIFGDAGGILQCDAQHDYILCTFCFSINPSSSCRSDTLTMKCIDYSQTDFPQIVPCNEYHAFFNGLQCIDNCSLYYVLCNILFLYGSYELCVNQLFGHFYILYMFFKKYLFYKIFRYPKVHFCVQFPLNIFNAQINHCL